MSLLQRTPQGATMAKVLQLIWWTIEQINSCMYKIMIYKIMVFNKVYWRSTKLPFLTLFSSWTCFSVMNICTSVYTTTREVGSWMPASRDERSMHPRLKLWLQYKVTGRTLGNSLWVASAVHRQLQQKEQYLFSSLGLQTLHHSVTPTSYHHSKHRTGGGQSVQQRQRQQPSCQSIVCEQGTKLPGQPSIQ